MPYLYLPPPLRSLTGGVHPLPVDGATVGEAIEAAERVHPGIKARLVRDGTLLPGFHVSIGDVMTRRGLAAPLEPESEVHFLPPIGGG